MFRPCLFYCSVLCLFLSHRPCHADDEFVYCNEALEVEFTVPTEWIPVLMPQRKPVRTFPKDEEGRSILEDVRENLGTLVSFVDGGAAASEEAFKQFTYRCDDVTQYRLRDCKEWLEAMKRHLEETKKSVRVTGHQDNRRLNRMTWGRMSCQVVEERQKCGERVERLIDTVIYVHMRELDDREVIHAFVAEFPEKATRQDLRDFEEIVGSCQFE